VVRDLIISDIVAGVIGYLVGSIPFGYIIGRARGVDIREHGSGNIGATNAGRVLGRKWFFIVFALDFLKGCVPVVLGWVFLTLVRDKTLLDINPASVGDVMLAAGIGALLGHVFPIYLGFRGGKAVATGLGVLAGLNPLAAVIAFGVFLLLLVLVRYMAVASMAGAIAAPLAYLIAEGGATWHAPYTAHFIAFIGAALFIIIRHGSNIRRLAAGTETRIILFGGKRDKGK
jgi:glycerol-3-phosphate acyltransferase PlsY